jgi:hypothetical protein
VYVDALRKSGDEYLDAARLRKLSARADARPSLSSVLRLFQPLQPEGLLTQLDGEEVHGLPARARAYEMLKASIEDPNASLDPFFQMNLVYLLRVVPRPPDAFPGPSPTPPPGEDEDFVDVVWKRVAGSRPSPSARRPSPPIPSPSGACLRNGWRRDPSA